MATVLIWVAPILPTLPLRPLDRTIIDDFPKSNLPGTESGRTAEYLNQCHWDVTLARLGLDEIGKEMCDQCRNNVPTRSNLNGTSFQDLEKEMDAAVEYLGKLELDGEQRGGWGSPTPGCKCYEQFNATDSFFPRGKNKKPIDPEMPFGSWADKTTRFGRMYHSAMPTSYILMPDSSHGRLTRLIQTQQEDERSAKKKLLEHMRTLTGIKTGGRSVNDPVLGITESPLGDATLLPVLALKDLKGFNLPVANWVGVTPTHAGFQFLQEACKEGQWFGRMPEFQLPKAYRDAGLTSIPMANPKSEASSSENGKNGSNKGKTSPTGFEDIDDIMRSRTEPGRSFSLTRGPDMGSERFTWSAPMTDEFMKDVDQMEEQCRNGGLAKVQRDLARCLRQYGVDAYFDIPDYGDVTDSDGEESSSGPVGSSASSSPKVPAKRPAETSSAGPEISAKKAKRWLESL